MADNTSQEITSCLQFFENQPLGSIKLMEFLLPPEDSPIPGSKGFLFSFKFKDGSFQKFISYWGVTTDVRSASIVHERYFINGTVTPWLQISNSKTR